jgi:hypothetical protein
MCVWLQADFVVGLDVDKDAYDKFNVRHEIDLLLLELWRDSHCRDCIRQQATAGGANGPCCGMGWEGCCWVCCCASQDGVSFFEA